MNTKPILIVAGEPNSIFLEIFFKTLKKNNFKKPIIIIVSKKLLFRQMKKLKFNFKINNIELDNLKHDLNNQSINLINVNYNFKKTFDKISSKSNKYISECFKIALKLLKEKKVTGLINGPISKKKFLKKKFPGITEYLASKTLKDKNIAMLIYNKKLSVSPLTTHLPLKEVHKHITKTKIINQVKLIREFYIKQFKKDPKIAITGLNPHCESNYKSSEEKNIIKPAIKYLIKKRYKVEGPYPADTIFMQNQSKKFNVIVGMFHDQVLTPIKTIFGFNAINITLGLPFIRISPDHGPNISMLGKNKSDPTSLLEALKFLDK
jgi:4-hydroxythreonine-4-phosphate dehydrogenase|tara:strand:- start:559 stop:1521 length:963 start_codon:yes stop_codon:yes gene_type:complete